MNCAFQNNAGSDGGAVNCSQGCNATFVNCLFADNTSSFRGGVLEAFASDVHFINCTLAHNFALYYGGGIYLQSATVELLNSIVWGNSDQEHYPTATSAQIYVDIGGTLNATNSCIQGFAGLADGNFGYDPLFASPSAPDYRLSSHSPAIDSGDPSVVTGYDTDLDRAARLANGTVDRGCYEFQGAPDAPVNIYKVPAAVTACNAGGVALFSATGTAGSGADFMWLVDKNDGQGFLPVIPDATTTFLTNDDTAFLRLTDLTVDMTGYLYEAALPAIGFNTLPAPLTVQLPGSYMSTARSAAGQGTASPGRMLIQVCRTRSTRRRPARKSGWRKAVMRPSLTPATGARSG